MTIYHQIQKWNSWSIQEVQNIYWEGKWKSNKGFENRGGKNYTSKEFELFWISEGMRHEVISSYTPKKNGIAKKRTGPYLTWSKVC